LLANGPRFPEAVRRRRDPGGDRRLLATVLREPGGQATRAKGYGGSFEDAARSVGKGGDGGIDGIIKEDRQWLDAIYIQVKRWKNVVGRPETQKIVGALTGFRAKKGVFITTSDFTSEARNFVQNLEAKVALLDGPTLAEYMIEVGLGVSLVQS
jgi:restriction system protein